MTNTNDVRILEMKKKIEEKKEKLGKITRFAPLTNCSLELDGARYNINVSSKEQLIFLMVKLNTYLMSAKVLGVAEQLVISGYSPVEWIEDIRSKADNLSKADEVKSLKAMEDKLLKLLSDGKKTELEIDEIESMLG